VYPDVITVGTRIESISHDRFSLRHMSISHAHNRIVAEGDDTCVMYDYRTLSKARLPTNLEHVMRMFLHSPSSATKPKP
jgi:acyl-CoA thioesterase FadM